MSNSFIGPSPSGKAPGFDPGMRRFELRGRFLFVTTARNLSALLDCRGSKNEETWRCFCFKLDIGGLIRNASI